MIMDMKKRNVYNVPIKVFIILMYGGHVVFVLDPCAMSVMKSVKVDMNATRMVSVAFRAPIVMNVLLQCMGFAKDVMRTMYVNSGYVGNAS